MKELAVFRESLFISDNTYVEWIHRQSLFFNFGIGEKGRYSIPKLDFYSLISCLWRGHNLMLSVTSKVMICFLTGFAIIWWMICLCSYIQADGSNSAIQFEKMRPGLMMLKVKGAATPIFKYSNDPYLITPSPIFPFHSFPSQERSHCQSCYLLLLFPPTSAWKSSKGARRGIRNIEVCTWDDTIPLRMYFFSL